MSSTPKKPPSTGASVTAASRKPPAATTTTNSATSNISPSRAPVDMSTGSKSSIAGSVNRVRSVRNSTGTPVSARAAARKQAATDAADEDAKAEMQAKLDELQDKLNDTEQAQEESQKQATLLQARLDEALREQGVLEENIHEYIERIEELESEKKDTLRARRELEQIYEAERVQIMKEKEESLAKEEEMQSAMQRMRDTLAQKEMRDRASGLDDDRRPSLSRTGSFRSGNASPNTDGGPGAGGQFAPPSSLQRSDSRSSSRLVMQKDKIIEGLRLELAEAQIKLVELENRGGGRVHELEKEMYDIKMQNARLMEENESFSLLLSEKTLNGDFAHSDLLRPPSTSGSPSRSRAPTKGASLADELEGEPEEPEVSEGAETSDRRLQGEISSLKDQNKALTLYINNIISRLLQHEQFEQILDKTPDLMSGPGTAVRTYVEEADGDKDLPPPPPPKDDRPGLASANQDEGGVASGLLQRARSVMGGGPKKRPNSIVQPNSHPAQDDLLTEPKVTENPDTAPRIPLGRSGSTRASGGHRRVNSDWPAASVVTNMYRGPSPALQGPTSPGLSSPTLTGRNSFFTTAQPLGGGPMLRQPSGSSVPTISEVGKENALPGESRTTSPPQVPAFSTHQSHRSSVTSNPSDFESLDTTATASSSAAVSNPSSPPRSTSSSSGGGDREAARSGSGGAIMMGSKPRPLRLVQEAQDDEKAKRNSAGNRSSWFGWMNKGVVPAGVQQRSASGGEGGGQ